MIKAHGHADILKSTESYCDRRSGPEVRYKGHDRGPLLGRGWQTTFGTDPQSKAPPCNVRGSGRNLPQLEGLLGLWPDCHRSASLRWRSGFLLHHDRVASFGSVKQARGRQNWSSTLQGDDSASRERPAVPEPFHLEFDRSSR